MNEDKRKSARTQGRYSDGDREFSRRSEKSSSKMSAGKNKGDKRTPPVGPREQKEIDLQYEEKSDYSFKELEQVRKPQEISFTDPVKELSETENGTSRLYYDQNFMKTSEADEYFTVLENSTQWHDKNIVIKGIEYPQPRLVAWYGPHPYTYAGSTLEAREMPSAIREIKQRVEAWLRKFDINVELNSVLLNLYRNGKDSVAWHSDDELTLGVCPTIASVSLGETRKFEMRPKLNVKDLDPNDIRYVNLTNGSLIVMDGCMQKDWQHRVPKEFHDKKRRINLTFRTIYPIDQLPPEIPHLSDVKSARSSSSKVVHQQDHMFDAENFPPLGMEINDKKAKNFPKENVSKNSQQPVVKRKFYREDYKHEHVHTKHDEKISHKEEIWDSEMLQDSELPEETEKIQNDLSKEASFDPEIDSSEFQPSQVDLNSNDDLSPKSYNIKLSPSEYMTTECQSVESTKTCDFEYGHEGLPESKPVKINGITADSGRKFMLNADAPDFVPQNQYEKLNLADLIKYCKNNLNRNENLPSFTKTLIKRCLDSSESPILHRDVYELEVYEKLNDGSLSDKHLRTILERIASMMTNAFQRMHDPAYGRNSSRYNSNENYQKPRPSYSYSRRY